MNSTIKNYFEISDNNIILLNEINISCDNIEKIIQKTWENIMRSNLSAGMDGINQLFNEFEIAIKYIDSINKISDFKIDISSIFQKFTLLEEAMSIPDYILIADILKYEIEVIVREWKEKTTDVLKMLKN